MTDRDRHWSTSLATMRACADAVRWAQTQESIEAAWAVCDRGDWMLWLLSRTNVGEPWSDARKPLVLAA